MKILIAEDTEDSRIMLEMALAAQGYEVMSGTNGIEALHLMQTATPDLIIADIMMPEMDGFDLCRKVKADPNLKHIPFIFYTATYTDHRDEELAMALGAARFLIKPLEPKVLIQTIQEVLAAYQAEDAETIQATQSKEQEIDSMHLQSVGRKLDEKLVELEQERQALKKSEEKYRHLVEAIQDYYFFYTHDTEGIFTYLSPSIEIMLGYTPEEFLLHYSEYLTDSPINKEVEYHTQLSIKGEEQPPYEIELYHKNGSIHWLEVKEIPVFDEQGHVSHIDGIAHDITERKQAEKALRHGLKMDAVGQLTGGIAHDFNNILAIIMGNLDLLERVMPEGDKTLVQVKSMKKAGQRATDLTRQLLSFSRREPKQTTTTNINRVIKTMDSLIARSVTPEVELEYNLTDDLWLTRIDPGDFEDVLLNLSINARDAMASHGHLSIETRNVNIDAAYCEQKPEATPGEYVQLSVSDSGDGISPELLERIFEPFYTTKGPGKGTGLGLAMVFGFTKRSGGFITCYSEVGVGSTF
ncbi:MAG TPA: response regulator, partial [Ectothiorhodospiraceae bacterium]|nr:response regulator [Ectothiorhodospiraceae bacterium]